VPSNEVRAKRARAQPPPPPKESSVYFVQLASPVISSAVYIYPSVDCINAVLYIYLYVYIYSGKGSLARHANAYASLSIPTS
jgi:hypothetical protein